MTTATFDTLHSFKALVAAGLTDAQAEAIVASQQDALRQSELATKADLAAVRTDLAEVKAELVKWVVSVGVVQTGLIAGLVMVLVK